MAETHLIVTQPFGDYSRGDRIDDHDAQREVLKTHGGYVNAIKIEPQAEPAQSEQQIADEAAKADAAKTAHKPAAASPDKPKT